MAGPRNIENNSQPFKLTVESFNRPANGAANAPRQFANAQVAPNPQPVAAQAQPKRGFFAWIASWFKRAAPAPAPVPQVAPAPDYVVFNNDLVENMINGGFADVPQDIQDALAPLPGRMRDIFGEAAVPGNAGISRIVAAPVVAADLRALRDAANGQGRRLTAAEVANVYMEKALSLLAYAAVGKVIAAKGKALDPDLPFSERSVGVQFGLHSPGVVAEIKACGNPAEVEAAIMRHEAEVDGFAKLVAQAFTASKSAISRAEEKLAAALGIDRRLVAAHVVFDDLRAQTAALSSDIATGKAPGCKEPGYDVNAAFEAKVDEFVDKRISACAEIDSLDIPDGVKSRWKAVFLDGRSLPMLAPSQLLEVARAIEPGKIEAALAKNLPQSIALDMMKGLADSVHAEMKKATGNANVLAGKGVDDLSPVFDMLIAFAKDKRPSLGGAIEGAHGRLMNLAAEYMEKRKFSMAGMFVKALFTRGMPLKNSPVTGEAKFLAIVERETEAALAECGVTDAEVVRDAKAAMIQRGRVALGREGSLKGLSDFLATVKADTRELGRALDGILKVKAAVPGVAATTIAVSTGLGKSHVLNNLDVSGLVSRSGKLHFLYLDVMDGAQKGEAIDFAAVSKKADAIVQKFISSKIAILKAIDEAGFDIADRAEYAVQSLRTADWTDPELSTAARKIAENKTLANAFRLLSGALKGEAAGTLDDVQLRDAFLFFGKVFKTTMMSEEFAPYVEKWAGAPNTFQLLQEMTLRLLSKDQPGIAGSIASLAASGRIDRVSVMMADGMKKTHALKLDYITLHQYGLFGDPAGEKIRGVMNDPTLKFSEEGFRKATEDDELYSFTNTLTGILTTTIPAGDAAAAERRAALETTGRMMIEKYAVGLTQDTIPLLKNLVGVLDWREGYAEASENILKDYVADMKAWRDIAPGSPDANGLEAVFERRMNDYLKDVLAGKTHGSFNNSSGMFQTFHDDLPRCKFVFNGKTAPGSKYEQRVAPFLDAVKDPAKRKAVSVMINQQLFGDFTASVANRIALVGWAAGMEDEPVDNIPGIEKFASRDITKTGGFQLFGTGPMSFEVDIAPDESTVKVRAKSAYPLHADITHPSAQIGTCTVTQEFTIDFASGEAEIKDLKIGQTFA